MKPAPFEYLAARSVEEAVAHLGEDARVLAGGQSLVPLLNLRLARPQRIVDINPIAELGVIRRTDGVLKIGAMVRQAALERSLLVNRHWPLLAQAVRHVGHAATRSRGTVGGSVAHADPKAELPIAFAALDATFVTTTRRLTAEEFTLGPLTTALEADELLLAIEVPPLPAGARTAFLEHARTHGDFADAAVAVVVAPGHTKVATLPAAGDAHQQALVAELTRRALEQVGEA
jgi:CO/xanthine dehydrogenase FAD-binding subunit